MLPRLRVASILCCIGALAMCAPAGAYVATVAPASGPPTTVVTLNGSGFPATSLVDIYWDTTQIGFGSTTATGALTPVSINVPASASLGIHYITVKNDGAPGGAQAAFQIRTNWLSYRWSAAQRNYNATENTLTPATIGNVELHWTAPITAGHYVIASPLVVSGYLYTRDGQGDLAKWSLSTHALVWKVATGLAAFSGISWASGNILMTAPGTIRAYSSTTGALVWQGSLGGTDGVATSSAATVAAGVVYVFAEGASTPGGLFAFSATCGKGGATCLPLWRGTGGVINAAWLNPGAPTVADGVVVANSYVDGPTAWAAACVPTAGLCAPLWTTGTPYSPGSAPYAAGYVWLPDGANHVAALRMHCLNTVCSSVKLLSTAEVDNDTVAIAGASVFVSDGTTLQEFSTPCSSTCGAIQSSPEPSSDRAGPTVAGGLVYVAGNGEVWAYDRSCIACGAIWSAAADGFYNNNPVVADGVLYVVDAYIGILVYDLQAAGLQIVTNRTAPAFESLRRDPRFAEVEGLAWQRLQVGRPITDLQPKVTPAAGDED